MEQSLAAPALAVGQAQALQPDQALDLGQAHALPAPMAPSEDQAAQLQHIAPQPSMHSADSPQLQLAEKKAAQAAPASLPKPAPEPDATPSLRKRPGSDPGQGL